MTVSIRRMSLGTGYEYLLSSVARGDGSVAASSPLTRYYAESGTPPGRFLGAGLSGLHDGAGVAEGSEVTESMLFNLLGMLADPITGTALGSRPLPWPASQAERVRLRVAQLRVDLVDAQRESAVAAIEAEESEREKTIRRPVAGFDLTFSVPKSVSAVWAVADAGTQVVLYQAHQDAIRTALSYAEAHVFFSRSGKAGAVQEPIRGVVAAAFDHWDSRAGDPHLHTHVVVANRVQTLDGTWRTLDSKTLHRYVVALSELHEGVLHDLLTGRLGYAWDERTRRHSSVARHDIAGVPDELITEFSRRSTDIETATATLIAAFARTHARQPSNTDMLRLRQQATLQTRPDKQRHTLAGQTAKWRERARPFVDGDTATWADTLRGRTVLPPLRADDIDLALLHQTARLALDTVAAKRATFAHANVLAEVHRQLHGARFATPADRLAVADRMTAAALDAALRLTAPDRVAVGAQIYTTRTILDAESRLLDAGRSVDAPAVSASAVADVVAEPLPGTDHHLGPDQAAAVQTIATCGRRLDVLVGPAGTGKTTSLAALRQAWEYEHGTGSVIGLAPSAAAAEVLADDLGIDTENTAKWLHEAARQNQRLDRMTALVDQINTRTSSPSTLLARQLRAQLDEAYAEYERWMIRPGQLVIVDEAGLAGTLALDRLVAEARDADAKVLLVGDWAQLSAIEAGGAFDMLVTDRPDAAELTNIRRFHNEWEREASLQLRVGDQAAITTYAEHDRIRSGDRSEM
ncbi:MAG: TrwC relaxase, partial [Jatrophihabitans sp.]|nr:TrwC relaxase [Jatrophihabitans sp.]